MSIPTSVEEFPLIFEYDPNHKINYFRNQRKPDWDLSKEAEPLNLWQPNVIPGPNGGSVQQDPSFKKKKRTDFTVASKWKDPVPNQQNWKLTTGTKSSFTLECDEMPNNRYVLITPRPGKFCVNLIADDFVITKDMEEKDAEECERQMEAEKEKAFSRRKAQNKSYYEFLEKEEKEKKETIINMIKDDIITDDFAPVDDDDGSKFRNIDDPEVREIAMRRTKEQTEEADVDAPQDRSDDEVLLGKDDQIDEDFDMEQLIELTEKGFLDEEEEDFDEEKESKKKEAKEETPKDKPASSTPGDNKEPDIDKMVIDIMGPEVIKEEEFVRFFLDVGQASYQDLFRRFKDKLVTDKQKEVFKRLIIKKCKKIDKGGTKFQLRSK